MGWLACIVVDAAQIIPFSISRMTVDIRVVGFLRSSGRRAGRSRQDRVRKRGTGAPGQLSCLRKNLDVIQRRQFLAVGDAFDANLIAGAKREARNAATSGRISVGFERGKTIVG